ncbi:MAG: hypothetical protein QW594_00160 [Candidatus Woesearchaeota archaeon]
MVWVDLVLKKEGLLPRAEQLGCVLYELSTDLSVTTLEEKNRQAAVLDLSGFALEKVSLSQTQVLQQLAIRKPRFAYGLEESQKHDFLHYRRSGMNHIFAQAFAKHQIIYLFVLSSLRSAPAVQRAKLLGRWMQNIMLLQKAKARFALVSFAKQPYELFHKKDGQGLLFLVGAGNTTAKAFLTERDLLFNPKVF